MGMLDDFGTKSREFSQKARGMSDIVSMNNNIAKMEKHLQDLYAELGKMYYEEYALKLDNPEYAEHFLQIGRLRQEIDRAGQYVSDLRLRNNVGYGKSTKTCPECGKLLEGEAKFCIKCGASVKDVFTNDTMQATIRRTPQPDASAMVKKVDQRVTIMDEKLEKLENELSNERKY